MKKVIEFFAALKQISRDDEAKDLLVLLGCAVWFAIGLLFAVINLIVALF